jgi:hypothetical protein
MTVTISLPPEKEAMLRERAAAAGKEVPAFVAEALDRMLDVSEPPAPPIRTAEEFDRALDEFFEENPEKLPSLPEDFSREDIYFDHD